MEGSECMRKHQESLPPPDRSSLKTTDENPPDKPHHAPLTNLITARSNLAHLGHAQPTSSSMIKSISIPVRELMSRDLVVLQPDDTLQKVEQSFRAYNIHHIPVVDESGQLKGLVTRSDFSRANHLLAHFRQDFKSVLVKDIMTRQLATITPDQPVQSVAEVFLTNIMHAMPVVDGGMLVGIITTQDLLRYLLEQRKQLTEQK